MREIWHRTNDPTESQKPAIPAAVDQAGPRGFSERGGGWFAQGLSFPFGALTTTADLLGWTPGAFLKLGGWVRPPTSTPPPHHPGSGILRRDHMGSTPPPFSPSSYKSYKSISGAKGAWVSRRALVEPRTREVLRGRELGVGAQGARLPCGAHTTVDRDGLGLTNPNPRQEGRGGGLE